MAIWVENSKDFDHGGQGWEFGTCLWAPTQNRGGRVTSHHKAIEQIRTGDLIVHLRITSDRGSILYGYSYAISDGFITDDQPPLAGSWAEASTTFFRVNLSGITPFSKQLTTKEFFSANEDMLWQHAEGKKHFFYTRRPKQQMIAISQGYCFRADEFLWELIQQETSTPVLDELPEAEEDDLVVKDLDVDTDEKLRAIRARVGQGLLATKIKALYKYQCCIPECPIDEPSFLIASHIARWSDNQEARGLLDNVLCLCVFHDKAFELGYFTLTDDLRIELTENKLSNESIARLLENCSGKRITTPADLSDATEVTPSVRFIQQHRARVLN